MWPGHMKSMASPVLPKAGGIDRCHPVSMGESSCPELTQGQAGDPTLSMSMDSPCWRSASCVLPPTLSLPWLNLWSNINLC